MPSAAVVASFSRPVATRASHRLRLPNPRLSASLDQRRTILSPQVFQVRARGRGRPSSGKQPEDNDDEKKEDEPKKEEEPIVEPDEKPSEVPEAKSTPEPSPSVPEEKPVEQAKSQKQSDDADVEDEAVQPWKEDRAADIRKFKASLLSAVAGFDRGFAAVPKDTAMIRNIVESLETLSGSIDLTGEVKTEPSSQEIFNGTWKLIFSSAFNAPRPRRSLLFSPFTFGPVYQVIDTQKRELDNVLELLVTNAPRFPWTPSNSVPKIRVTLKHDMSYSMSIVSITLKETDINILDSGFEIPKVTLPSLSSAVRSVTGRKSEGEFSLVYLDEDLRITEGDRSELRIFVKVSDLD